MKIVATRERYKRCGTMLSAALDAYEALPRNPSLAPFLQLALNSALAEASHLSEQCLAQVAEELEGDLAARAKLPRIQLANHY